MIIVTRPGVTDAEIDHIRERIESAGMRTHLSRGEVRTIIGCIGDESRLAEVSLRSLPGVESVTPVLKPYKLASREFSVDRSIVRVGGRDAEASFGGDAITVIAGPCSVENREMLVDTARAVKSAGAVMLRGGAFKPRTSPYAFQGMGLAALELLVEVRALTGLPVVTEVMDTRQVDLVAEHADMLQVGARNMQNFALLAELGRVRRPVLLKRETHLPVIVDPSHAGGDASLVAPLAFAAIAAGADGLIVEVHPDPECALSDGDQSLAPPAFEAMMQRLAAFAAAAGRPLSETRLAGATA